MTKMFQRVSLFVFLFYLLSECANVQAPTGGPKDEKPAVLLSSIPAHQSVSYQGTVITLEFDEFVRLDNLSQNLIITPKTEIQYKTKIRRNRVTLTFEESLEDSTTYTFNFGNSVKDITEGNITENLFLAFSTGPSIDSAAISGNVRFLLDNTTKENVLVGLYRPKDSVNLFEDEPYYFTKTNSTGDFSFQNLKEDDYILFAFDDSNKNLKVETDREAYAFLSDTINIIGDSLQFNLFLNYLNTKPVQLNSARALGHYFEVKYNKSVNLDSLIIPSNPRNLNFPYLPADNQATIRFYNPDSNLQDSLTIFSYISDSLNAQLADTIVVKFSETRRDRNSLTSRFPNNPLIDDSIRLVFSFNKPIIGINTDSIYFFYDSLNTIPINDSVFTYSRFKDSVYLNTFIKKQIIETDTSLTQAELDARRLRGVSEIQYRSLSLYIGQGAFISADLDSTEVKTIDLQYIIPEQFGTLLAEIDTSQNFFIFQILTTNFDVFRQYKNQNSINVDLLPPGQYRIRILVDENANGIWDYPNILENKIGEPVIHYLNPSIPEGIFDIKANWEVGPENITF